MDNYETEEQQVEAIKKWWADNYIMVIVAILIGLGSIVGIQQWKQNKVLAAHTASVEYDHILQAVKNNKEESIEQQVNTMLSDFSDYPYAALSALLDAKKMIEAKNFAEAEKRYQWVINNSQMVNLQHIARLRLASLKSAQGKNEEALALLDVNQDNFKASYLEARGDILVLLKRIDDARNAYDQAIQAYAAMGSNSQILKIKRNDLGNS